jgi:hypothetical protein
MRASVQPSRHPAWGVLGCRRLLPRYSDSSTSSVYVIWIRWRKERSTHTTLRHCDAVQGTGEELTWFQLSERTEMSAATPPVAYVYREIE